MFRVMFAYPSSESYVPLTRLEARRLIQAGRDYRWQKPLSVEGGPYTLSCNLSKRRVKRALRSRRYALDPLPFNGIASQYLCCA